MPKKQITRSAVIDSTPVTGNLVRVASPKALTLTGSPSNRTPFRVIRSTAGEPTMSKTAPKARRVSRSSGKAPILAITFPEGTTEEGVDKILESFGMQSGYDVSETEGIYTARRSDVQSIAIESARRIPLTEDGIVAFIERSEAPADSSDEAAMTLRLASIDIDLTRISRDDATAWLKDNKIADELGAGESDETITIARSELADGTETRAISVVDGITFNVVRDDGTGEYTDIPSEYVAVVNEAAYGGWGWGILDFSQAVGNSVFSEQVRSGLNILDDVLRQILFYSELPLAVRKTLVNNALSQFADFVNSYMDILPKQVVISVARFDKPTGVVEMTQTNATAATAAGAAPAATNEDQIVSMTRSELSALIRSEIAAVNQSGDPIPATQETVTATPTPAAGELAGLTRSDLTAAFAEAVKPLTERIEKMESTTIVRSDVTGEADKDNTVAAVHTDTNVKRSDSDVFAGVIPGIPSRRK